jgi:hypothetical protein
MQSHELEKLTERSEPEDDTVDLMDLALKGISDALLPQLVINGCFIVVGFNLY